MNERTPWLKEVIEALKELGGKERYPIFMMLFKLEEI